MSWYVIVEFNQASGQPKVYDTDVYHDRADADDDLEDIQAISRASGRMERHRVFELTEVDDDAAD